MVEKLKEAATGIDDNNINVIHETSAGLSTKIMNTSQDVPVETHSDSGALCLHRHLSDHRPILLREVQLDFGLTPFRFYHSWFDFAGFDDMIKLSWHSFSHSDTNGMIRFKKKLQDLKIIIRRWVKTKRLELSGILNHLQLPREHVLNCFIDGLKEEIQGMVRLFKPQSLREAYYLAKIHELTLSKTKPKDPTRTPKLSTPSIRKEKNHEELHKSADFRGINTEFQACLHSDAHNIIQSEEMLNAEISIALMENHDEKNVGATMHGN
ncbi:RNA-directed DNA polymerase, eukaryota, Reverse transcriptase zinc-binding domain protein [Artemisia annua]|uniref:RNA-directed DNA polymerase, eukaryota, Reverse transcriptase zinc-binding domain protein n=1 Tax=Artemisia annua TaxID=35608 RepID=A0A2U1KZB1_ARTAN|nr:RNA-directed DNA polymerase, eukaryota, Reverse transcriptase zinc-binding domain protein [Artemisia annua]